MWQSLWANALSRLFGDGLGADIAGRASVYLADEVRRSLDKEPERLTTVRLRPGESYTVIARPPATREERRLAAAKARLQARDDHLSRPTRRQLRTARKLRTPPNVAWTVAAPAGAGTPGPSGPSPSGPGPSTRSWRPRGARRRAHADLESVTRRLDDSRDAIPAPGPGRREAPAPPGAVPLSTTEAVARARREVLPRRVVLHDGRRARPPAQSDPRGGHGRARAGVGAVGPPGASTGSRSWWCATARSSPATSAWSPTDVVEVRPVISGGA